MATETITGKFDQLKGQVKQSVGEATGNEKLANSGAADQVKGAAKEAWGNTKEAAQAVSNDARAHAEARRTETEIEGHEKAHSVRDSIVNTAQNLKDSVIRHTENVKAKH
jgi:uncharacterized protein YjbJ (UPF0337 family)